MRRRRDPHLSKEMTPLHSAITWGRDRVGVGLLKALYARAGISFSDGPSPMENVPPKADQVVVCEEGEALSQVIARQLRVRAARRALSYSGGG